MPLTPSGTSSSPSPSSFGKPATPNCAVRCEAAIDAPFNIVVRVAARHRRHRREVARLLCQRLLCEARRDARRARSPSAASRLLLPLSCSSPAVLLSARLELVCGGCSSGRGEPLSPSTHSGSPTVCSAHGLVVPVTTGAAIEGDGNDGAIAGSAAGPLAGRDRWRLPMPRRGCRRRRRACSDRCRASRISDRSMPA